MRRKAVQLRTYGHIFEYNRKIEDPATGRPGYVIDFNQEFVCAYIMIKCLVCRQFVEYKYAKTGKCPVQIYWQFRKK